MTLSWRHCRQPRHRYMVHRLPLVAPSGISSVLSTFIVDRPSPRRFEYCCRNHDRHLISSLSLWEGDSPISLWRDLAPVSLGDISLRVTLSSMCFRRIIATRIVDRYAVIRRDHLNFGASMPVMRSIRVLAPPLASSTTINRVMSVVNSFP